jgi:long-chain acyl-CoA synthetase
MYMAIMNHPQVHKYNVSSIRVCSAGSAPMPIEAQKRFEELTGAKISEGYGLTEASPVTHANPFLGKRKIGSIGLPRPDVDSKIVDLETGEKDLPPGEKGELCIRGPQVMLGYWNRPEETSKALRNGWLYTGDIARMDEEGYFYIVDRKKDMIICSGYNVYPREIEEVLYQHPKIQEACILGVPDPYRGETVKAFVVLKENQQATAEEIIEYCQKNMAKYKVPTSVEFRQELPKSHVGKVLRKILREEEIKKSSDRPS